jgi:hypothetical protein
MSYESIVAKANEVKSDNANISLKTFYSPKKPLLSLLLNKTLVLDRLMNTREDYLAIL